MRLQVHHKALQAEVVVVQLEAAQRNVHVDGNVFGVRGERALVGLQRLLVVAPRVVHGGETQLVLHAPRAQLCVASQQRSFIAQLCVRMK